jgi:cation:H+ antiporter
MTYLMVAGGLVLLLVGGDILVRGAVSLSQCFGLPPLLIGLTVVAFGTSSPELVVCINAALAGAPELAIGNVVGSNIANILLVLGLPATIFPIACGPGSLRRDTVVMLLASIGFVLLAFGGNIERWHGLLMLAGLLGFLFWCYRSARSRGYGDDAVSGIDEISGRPRGARSALGFVVVGLAGLVLGSELLVHGAVSIAADAGVSQAVIGLTVVALGTSLPELATSLVAAVRRHGDVAIGNVVGSNLFNLLGIMGITALVAPIPVPAEFVGFDFWVMLAATLLLLVFAARGRAIGRITGGLLSIAYCAYVYALFAGVSHMPDLASL